MDFLLSTKILERARQVILNADKEITVISPNFDYDFASLLLDRASRGINTTVITGNPDWASWLENKKKSYGMDEINELMKEREKHKREQVRLMRLRIVTPAILTAVGVSAFLLIHKVLNTSVYVAVLPLVILVIISVYAVMKFQKRIVELNSTISIQQQSLDQRLQEISNIRQEIQKNLKCFLNPGVYFTLVYNG
ncbi:MAG: hypothetical protein RXR07_05715, partial [Sulfolobaceae archaeon]